MGHMEKGVKEGRCETTLFLPAHEKWNTNVQAYGLIMQLNIYKLSIFLKWDDIPFLFLCMIILLFYE